MAHEDLHPETIAISSGRPPHVAGEGINLPISLNSTFVAGGPINYGRTGNETWHPLENAISALEEAESTLLFSSGMSAITAVFSLLPHGAPIVASHEGYSGTMSLLKRYHEQGRLEVRFVDITDTKEVILKIIRNRMNNIKQIIVRAQSIIYNIKNSGGVHSIYNREEKEIKACISIKDKSGL